METMMLILAIVVVIAVGAGLAYLVFFAWRADQ